MSIIGTGPMTTSPFGSDEFDQRIAATRAAMEQRGSDALLIVSPENVYYLLGLNSQGYFAFTLLVLPLSGQPRLLTRAVEQPTVAAQVSSAEHVTFSDDDDLVDAAINAIKGCTQVGHTLGVERAAMFFPLNVAEGIKETLTDRHFVDGSGLVEQVRAVKSPSEIALLRRAARISDKAMRAGIDAAGSDVSEREVAAHVYHKMIAAGSEDPGFAPLIRASDALAQEHVTWRDRRLVAGEGLFFELSGSVNRYHAPLSRLVHVNYLPSGVQRTAEIALAGLRAITETLRPGVTAGQVYAAWQEVIDEGLGHHDYRRHHCGYMIGIGFPPSWVGGSAVVGLRARSTLEIQSGMVFHVLSWVLGQQIADYLVSDTALITEDGCELLTSTPREPLAVD